MASGTENSFVSVLQQFAAEVTEKFSLSISFNPEDQLKAPIETLLKSSGSLLNLSVSVVTEVQERALSGRPDVGVAVRSLLTGHIELKAPGKGADPNRLRGADKQQWEKFKNLPNIPITKDTDLFERVVAVGRKLIWLHTYGDRFVPNGKKAGRISTGTARCKVGTPTTAAHYPTKPAYDVGTQELRIGGGIFENVRQEVWEFSVSGLKVVQSWLAYRMKAGAGRKSSPLDDIRPKTWQFDNELLDLLWVLDATVDLFPQLSSLFDEVLKSQLFVASNFPQPTEAERTNSTATQGNLTLFAWKEAEKEEAEEEEEE